MTGKGSSQEYAGDATFWLTRLTPKLSGPSWQSAKKEPEQRLLQLFSRRLKAGSKAVAQTAWEPPFENAHKNWINSRNSGCSIASARWFSRLAPVICLLGSKRETRGTSLVHICVAGFCQTNYQQPCLPHAHGPLKTDANQQHSQFCC